MRYHETILVDARLGLAWLLLASCQTSNGSSPPVATVPLGAESSPLVSSVDPGAAPRAITSAVPSDAADAAPMASSTPQPPAPSMESCQGRMPNPFCAQAFPEKVDCPATYADVPEKAYCGLLQRTKPARCSYPEGVCKCVHVPYCGGAYPSQLQSEGMTWSCGPHRGPSDCPENAAPGARCTKNGQACTYGGCGTSTNCTCTNGKYNCATRHWAPPP